MKTSTNSHSVKSKEQMRRQGYLDQFQSDPYCCGGCCPIKHGTLILAIFELLVACGLLISVVKEILHFTWPTDYTQVESSSGIVETIACAHLDPRANVTCPYYSFRNNIYYYGTFMALSLLCFWIATTLALIYGLLWQKSFYFIPHLVLQLAVLVFSLVVMCYHAWNYINVHIVIKQLQFDWLSFSYTMWVIGIVLILIAVEIYIIMVVITCYRHIRRREDCDV